MASPFTPSPLFPAAKAHYDALNAGVAQASARLNAVPGIGAGPMGLTPDAVKFSPEYQEAARAYRHWAGIARDYAGTYCKQFARELRAEREARRTAGKL